jgi:tetratricopeptide (TPR) repeat protein
MKNLAIIIILLTFSKSLLSQGCKSISKGMAAINKSEIDEAKKYFDTAAIEIEEAKANGESPQIKCYAKYYYGLGHVAWQRFESSKVVDLVEKVALLDEAEKHFLNFFELSYDDDAYTTRASTDLEAVANRQKGLAIDYYNSEDYQSAMRLFEKAIKNKVKLGGNYLDLHAYESAAITSSILGNHEKAIKYINVLLQNPDAKVNGEANNQEKNLRRKSAYLADNGNTIEAISNLDSALKIFPQSIPLKKEKLRIYNEIGNLDSVIVLLEDITQKVDNDVQMYTVMGGIYVKKGKLDESYKAYKKALEIEPKNKFAIFGLGVYYINRSNEYLQVPDTLTEEESDDIVKKQHKNIDKAIFYFNQYLEIEPGDRPTLTTLKQIYQAKGNEEKLAEIDKQLMGQ